MINPHFVHDDVIRMRHDFAGARHTTRLVEIRIFRGWQHRAFNQIMHGNGSLPVMISDVIGDVIEVIKCVCIQMIGSMTDAAARFLVLLFRLFKRHDYAT